MMLEPILEATRSRVAALPPVEELRSRANDAPPVRDFAAGLRSPGLQVIAEIKRRSPSAGPIDAELDPVVRAGAYAAGGAAAISVLTEPAFFGGSMDDLRLVRETVTVPLLRKDFVLDARQVWEARAAGADAVLLIVAVVGDRLASLLDVVREAGMGGLVEAHTVAEAGEAVTAGARIIGVNNRDLTTFETDLAVSERVAAFLPADVVRVAESGVSDAEDAARMAAAGYDAVLVGEALVRSESPAALIAMLRGLP